METCKKQKKSIILYTIVDDKLAEFLKKESDKIKVPCLVY